MAHVVFFILWEAGHLLPTFQIGRDLRLRGHRITYVTIPDLVDLPRARGFDTVPILTEAFPRGSHGRMLSTQAQQRLWLAMEKAAREGDVVRQIEDLQPDIVLIDTIFLPTYAAYLRGKKVPLVLVSTSLPNERRAGLPPVTIHTLPDGSISSRFAIEAAWTQILLWRWRVYLRRKQPMALPSLKTDLPELVLCSQAFDFPRAARSGRHYVGPSIETMRPAEEFPWHRLDAGARLIYCSFGTQAFRYDGIVELLANVVAAIGDQPGEQLVVTADRAILDQLGTLAPNVIAVERAPQIELLRRTTVAVIHGGLGTVKECILMGVPMIVVPRAFDQPGNAARVEFHSLGLRALGPICPIVIRSLLDQLIRSPEIFANVRRMGDIFRREQSDAPGATVIESYIRPRKPAEVYAACWQGSDGYRPGPAPASSQPAVPARSSCVAAGCETTPPRERL